MRTGKAWSRKPLCKVRQKYFFTKWMNVQVRQRSMWSVVEIIRKCLTQEVVDCIWSRQTGLTEETLRVRRMKMARIASRQIQTMKEINRKPWTFEFETWDLLQWKKNPNQRMTTKVVILLAPCLKNVILTKPRVEGLWNRLHHLPCLNRSLWNPPNQHRLRKDDQGKAWKMS